MDILDYVDDFKMYFCISSDVFYIVLEEINDFLICVGIGFN